MSLNMPKAVLFDNDGVLVASERLHAKAWAWLLNNLPSHLKMNVTEDEIMVHAGKTAPQILTTLLAKYHPQELPKREWLEARALEKNDVYLKMVPTDLKAYPGVDETLGKLKAAGLKIAVVSNAKRRELEAALHTTGIFRHFEVILSRDDVPEPKPSPVPYLQACRELGVRPEDAVAFEDSPTGLRAILSSPIRAVAILTTFPRETLSEPFPGDRDRVPHVFFRSVSEWYHEEFSRIPSPKIDSTD